MPCNAVIVMSLLSACAAALAQPPQPPADPHRPLPIPPLDKAAPEIAKFLVREGYEVSLAAMRVDNARFLEVAPGGWLYVSRPRIGDILALQDINADGYYDRTFQFVDQHQLVHGLCWHDGALWFATSESIFKAIDDDHNGIADTVTEVLGGLPGGGAHWWRSILVTDEHIYTSVGDSGNINDEEATDRQKIWRYNHSGGDKTLWSTGVRNSEKLRLRPGTSEIWGVDHGSDSLGAELGETAEAFPFTDHNPPDELNLYEQGKFYGHPFITGVMLPRPEFMKKEGIVEIASRTVAPRWKFGAHWAANGFTFIDPAINAAAREKGAGFPADHDGDLFVACRGSWNRSVRDGYMIARVLFDKDGTFGPEGEGKAYPATSATSGGNASIAGGRPYGLLPIVRTIIKQSANVAPPTAPDGSPTDQVLARPVDVVQDLDGSLLFSSDQPVGRIYRIRIQTQLHRD
jgi:glucose/arabinose dehydrogenase